MINAKLNEDKTITLTKEIKMNFTKRRLLETKKKMLDAKERLNEELESINEMIGMIPEETENAINDN